MGFERFESRRDIPSVFWFGKGMNFKASVNDYCTLLMCGIETHQLLSLWSTFVTNKLYGASNMSCTQTLVTLIKRWNSHHKVRSRGAESKFAPIKTRWPERKLSRKLRPRIPFVSACSISSMNGRAEVYHRKRYVLAQAYSDAVWSRWLKEYVDGGIRWRNKILKRSRDLKNRDLGWSFEFSSPQNYYPFHGVRI